MPINRLHIALLAACMFTASPLCLLHAQGSTTRAIADAQAAGEARLEPGDVIRITVWRKPEYSGEFTIDANGFPRHPLYKEVQVVGAPIAEVERRIIQLLKGYEQNPQLVIEPLFRVTIGGEVTVPNLYSLPRETTVLQAIAMAGGPRDRGGLNKVRIVRGTQVIETNLTQPTAEWANRRILSGDQIIVARHRNILTDVVTPFAAVVGALAAILGILRK